MKTNKQIQSDYRARRSNNGMFKRRDFWCHPDDEKQLRELEERLRQKRLAAEPDHK